MLSDNRARDALDYLAQAAPGARSSSRSGFDQELPSPIAIGGPYAVRGWQVVCRGIGPSVRSRGKRAHHAGHVERAEAFMVNFGQYGGQVNAGHRRARCQLGCDFELRGVEPQPHGRRAIDQGTVGWQEQARLPCRNRTMFMVTAESGRWTVWHPKPQGT